MKPEKRGLGRLPANDWPSAENMGDREVSVYALNYGLCQQQTIAFGRPREKREQRLFFVERIFDFSPS